MSRSSLPPFTAKPRRLLLPPVGAVSSASSFSAATHRRRVSRPPAPVPTDSDICFSFLDPRRVSTVHGVALVREDRTKDPSDPSDRGGGLVKSGGFLFTSRFLSAEFSGLLPDDATWNREKEAERLDSISRAEKSKRTNRKWGPSLLPGPMRRAPEETVAEKSERRGRTVILAFECPEQATAQARWLEKEPVLSPLQDTPPSSSSDAEEGCMVLTPLEMPVQDAVYVSGLMKLPLMVVRSARCGLESSDTFGRGKKEKVIVEAALLRHYSSYYSFPHAR